VNIVLSELWRFNDSPRTTDNYFKMKKSQFAKQATYSTYPASINRSKLAHFDMYTLIELGF